MIAYNKYMKVFGGSRKDSGIRCHFRYIGINCDTNTFRSADIGIRLIKRR